MFFWYGDVKEHLNFYIVKDLNFNFLIGHPIKALLKDVPKMGYLSINIGKDSLHILVNRAINYSVEDPPIIEPIEEVMSTSILESSDSDLERNPEEVIEADEDSNETFKLLETEKPSRPQLS